MWTAQYQKALQQVIKTAQNIISTHALIIDMCVLSVHSPKDTKRQYLLNPKYLPPSHQTSEEFLSSGSETNELIVYTSPRRIGLGFRT